MGIRYYAYPLLPTEVELARVHPRAFLSRDPLADAWGPAELRSPMLYLDKCWHQLQELLGPRPGRAARDAFQLVTGQVTHKTDGWIPFAQVLGPEEVRQVAEDLEQVDEEGVLAARIRGFHVEVVNDDPEELRYVMEYLNSAKEFLTALADDGLGLVYVIG